MAIRADTLFCFDARGRMLHSNEPSGRPAPRLFLGRTLEGDVVRFGASVPDTVARRLEEIVERLPPIADLSAPPPSLDVLREALTQHAPVAVMGGGPAYRFPASIAALANVVQLTDANRDLVRDTFPFLYDELAGRQPCFAVLDDGAAVAVCISSRNGADAAEAGVETLAAYRGRGHAAAVTAAWGAAIRESGRIPLYSTAWENLASQGVARSVGLIVFGADISWG
ncbi:MAG: GNAT family N-acetyltransferase [Thermomicrobiales bacterium]